MSFFDIFGCAVPMRRARPSFGNQTNQIPDRENEENVSWGAGARSGASDID